MLRNWRGDGDPRSLTQAAIFPGQGSQAIGMGKALADRYAAARDVFERVDAALGQHLSRLMFEGSDVELTKTANAQPALMAVSLAVVRVLEAEAGWSLARDAALIAGHSLGEYAALAAAGALTLEDAARLLRLRGNAMQDAVPAGEGAMAALLGVERDAAQSIVDEAAGDEVCDVANDNGGGQIVVSGTAGAVERAVVIAKSRGVKRAVMLQVSAPFHCRLMAPAAEAMRDALGRATIREPSVPVVANVLVRPIRDPDEIRKALVAQVCGTVRWRETLAFMAESGVTTFLELGAGKVLSGLVKRVVPSAIAISIALPEDVVAFQARAAQ
jgi:[acyl-carrier-protein] S-malonyltransferase